VVDVKYLFFSFGLVLVPIKKNYNFIWPCTGTNKKNI
jgi:hypothetical protein